MRTRDFIIFFSVVLLIYSFANIYIFIKGYKALEGLLNLKIYTILFISLASTFILGKILERNSSSVIVDILNVTGGFWLAFMLYAFLLFLLTDIAWGIGRISGLFENDIAGQFRYLSGLVVGTISVLILIIGFLNSVTPVKKEYSINLNKQFNSGESIRIAAVSDVHLGSVVRNRSLKQLSRIVTESNPDIVLFLGDLVDGEINPVIRDDLLKSLSLPDSCDVIAISGNHEYIGGIGKTIPYIMQHGITLLMDEVITLPSGIQLIGRKDRDSFRYTGEKRRELEDLVAQTDSNLPVVVLDHQPLSGNSSGSAGYDIMLSGHTHNGQMWPFNYIVNLLYKDSYGHNVYNNTHHIISSGFGTWGPRIRIGSRSEVIILNLNSL